MRPWGWRFVDWKGCCSLAGGRAGGAGGGVFVLHPQLPPEEHELPVSSTGAVVPQLPVLQLDFDVSPQPMGVGPY